MTLNTTTTLSELYLHITSVVTDSESATESTDFSDSVRIRIREFFVAVSDGFWSSVCESILYLLIRWRRSNNVE